MATDVSTMTDAELDTRLTRLYRQHGAALAANRAGWHDLIVAVLDEQRVRRDTWLAEGAALTARLAAV